MRRPSRTCLALAALAGCAGTPEDPTETQSRIVYGTPDTTHTAVVAVLTPAPGGYDQCTGTIVQVCGGIGYVLTAAHCCDRTAPTVVVMADDDAAGVPYVSRPGSPLPPTYAVLPGSIAWDPGYDRNALVPIDDFCMLRFLAPPDAPAIPVAEAADGLAVGAMVEYVGFGDTQNDPNNTVRRHASAPVDLEVDSNDFRYTEGGSTHVGGPCVGDSGGPALLPAGAPQAQQRVVGTTSYGDAACKQYGVSMRVTSQSAPGGFIASYLATCSAGPSAPSTSCGAECMTAGDAGAGSGRAGEAAGARGGCSVAPSSPPPSLAILLLGGALATRRRRR